MRALRRIPCHEIINVHIVRQSVHFKLHPGISDGSRVDRSEVDSNKTNK